MWDDIGQAVQVVPAVVLVAIAVAFAVLRIYRRDASEQTAMEVLERTLASTEKDRDYWRERALSAEEDRRQQPGPPRDPDPRLGEP